MYQATRLTVSDSVTGSATITIYNSVTQGSPINHSNILWFEYGILANANSDNTLTIEYTNDNGTTWNTYDTVNIGTSFVEGEKYIGHFEHVRITFTAGTSNVTSFFCNANLKAAQRVSNTAISFSPSELSKVTGWLALEDESGGSIADRIQSTTGTVNGSAVRSTNGNGFEQLTLDGSDDYIGWALTNAMNNDVFWGFAGWFRITNPASGAQNLAAHIGTSHVNRAFFRAESGGFSRLYRGASVQNIDAPNHATDTWQWIAVTFDGSQSGPGSDNQNRLQIYYGTVLQTYTTVNAGGSDTIPATLTKESVISGKFLGICGSSAGTELMTGRLGPNVYFLGGGHLTADENTNLMNYQSMSGAS